jgi:hypothetical protein
MRRLGYGFSLLLLATSACGGDDDDIDAAIQNPDATAGPDGATADGPAVGMAPSITQVSWAPMGACTAGAASNYLITTTVTDGDTQPTSITFSGSATSCTGTVDSASATLNCPNTASYPGTVTVTDPEGNSDTQAFTIGICMSGSAP